MADNNCLAINEQSTVVITELSLVLFDYIIDIYDVFILIGPL